jgi:hypothetical protein
MRRLKLLGLALVAVFASAAALATSASALELPENLPVSAVTRNWTGASDGAKPELLAPGLKITCESAPATGTEEPGKPLGLFHIEFKGCVSAGVACTGLGEAAGVILTLGTWHLVFDKVTSTELLTAVLFLPETTHFSCSALVLTEVLGSLLCLHLKPTESNVTHLFHCNVEGAGETEKQEDTKWCMKDVGGVCTEELTAQLLCSINHAAEKACFELALGSVTYTEKIFADI